MKIRIIGVETCQFCRRLVESYKNQNVEFEYWDGDTDDLQDELDKMNINDFPVVQIVADNGKLLYMWDYSLWPRGVSYRKVKEQMQKINQMEKSR